MASALTILEGIRFPVTSAGDFQEGLISTQKTVGQQFLPEIYRFGDALQSVSNDVNVLTLDLTKVSAIAGQLGLGRFGEEALTTFTDTSARFSSVLQVEVEKSTAQLAKIANIYKVPLSQAENISASFNEISNSSTATGAELLDVVSRIGDIAGISLDQALAIAATGKNLGVSSEVLGTTFANTLSKLEADAAKFSAFLGVSTQEWVEIVENDGVFALNRLFEELQKYDKVFQSTFIRQNFGAGRVFSTINKFFNDFTSGQDSLVKFQGIAEESFRKGTSSIVEQANVLKGLNAQGVILQNTFFNLTENVVRDFLPQITETVKNLQELFKREDTREFGADIANGVAAIANGLFSATQFVIEYQEAFSGLLQLFGVFLGLKLAKFVVGTTARFADNTRTLINNTKSWQALNAEINKNGVITKALSFADPAQVQRSRDALNDITTQRQAQLTLARSLTGVEKQTALNRAKELKDLEKIALTEQTRLSRLSNIGSAFNISANAKQLTQVQEQIRLISAERVAQNKIIKTSTGVINEQATAFANNLAVQERNLRIQAAQLRQVSSLSGVMQLLGSNVSATAQRFSTFSGALTTIGGGVAALGRGFLNFITGPLGILITTIGIATDGFGLFTTEVSATERALNAQFSQLDTQKVTALNKEITSLTKKQQELNRVLQSGDLSTSSTLRERETIIQKSSEALIDTLRVYDDVQKKEEAINTTADQGLQRRIEIRKEITKTQDEIGKLQKQLALAQSPRNNGGALGVSITESLIDTDSLDKEIAKLTQRRTDLEKELNSEFSFNIEATAQVEKAATQIDNFINQDVQALLSNATKPLQALIDQVLQEKIIAQQIQENEKQIQDLNLSLAEFDKVRKQLNVVENKRESNITRTAADVKDLELAYTNLQKKVEENNETFKGEARTRTELQKTNVELLKRQKTVTDNIKQIERLNSELATGQDEKVLEQFTGLRGSSEALEAVRKSVQGLSIEQTANTSRAQTQVIQYSRLVRQYLLTQRASTTLSDAIKDLKISQDLADDSLQENTRNVQELATRYQSLRDSIKKAFEPSDDEKLNQQLKFQKDILKESNKDLDERIAKLNQRVDDGSLSEKRAAREIAALEQIKQSNQEAFDFTKAQKEAELARQNIEKTFKELKNLQENASTQSLNNDFAAFRVTTNNANEKIVELNKELEILSQKGPKLKNNVTGLSTSIITEKEFSDFLQRSQDIQRSLLSLDNEVQNANKRDLDLQVAQSENELVKFTNSAKNLREEIANIQTANPEFTELGQEIITTFNNATPTVDRFRESLDNLLTSINSVRKDSLTFEIDFGKEIASAVTTLNSEIARASTSSVVSNAERAIVANLQRNIEEQFNANELKVTQLLNIEPVIENDFERKINQDIIDKNIVARVKVEAVVDSVSGAANLQVVGRRDGGPLGNFKRADGLLSGKGTSRSDSIPFMGSAGEFVLNAKTVKQLGGAAGVERLIQRLNNQRLPAFRNGGSLSPIVPRTPAIKNNNAAVTERIAIDLTTDTGQQVRLFAENKPSAQEFVKMLNNSKRTRG